MRGGEGGLGRRIWDTFIQQFLLHGMQVRALYSMYAIVGASVSEPHSMVQVMCACASWYKRKTSPVQVASNAHC